MKRGVIWWFVGGALALLVLARLFVVALFNIPAGSMIPTLLVGDHVGVNLLAKSPGRGDVFVFQYPKEPEKDFIKRVIAVGGDTVAVKGRQVILNGKPVAQRPLGGECQYDDYDEMAKSWDTRRCAAAEEELDGHKYTVVFDPDESRAREFPAAGGVFTVPPGHVFVLGDNRDNSHDSRYWGTVAPQFFRGTMIGVWLRGGHGGARIGK